jgi:hypothetical protein
MRSSREMGIAVTIPSLLMMLSFEVMLFFEVA